MAISYLRTCSEDGNYLLAGDERYSRTTGGSSIENTETLEIMKHLGYGLYAVDKEHLGFGLIAAHPHEPQKPKPHKRTMKDSDPNDECQHCGHPRSRHNPECDCDCDRMSCLCQKFKESGSERIRKLTVERNVAITLLANWCVQVEDNGASWDDWDEGYKDANSRPGPLRELIDKKKQEIRDNDIRR